MNNYNFEQEFKTKYPQHEFLIEDMRTAISKKEVTFDDMTAVNINRIVSYFSSKVSPNSASNYCTLLKGFLNLMSDDVKLPTLRFAKRLNVKKVPQQNVALTEDEVGMIDCYYKELLKKKHHQSEKDVLTLFLLECFCGGRGCDVEMMSDSNIKDGMLSYVSKKTHVLATMPVHHRIKELLENKPCKEYSRQTKNRIIKRVAERLGIDYPVTLFYHGKMVTKKKFEFLGMHTARRSFASILAAKGVSVTEIAQYMSHTNINMTQRYIKVDTNKASTAALSFFDGQ